MFPACVYVGMCTGIPSILGASLHELRYAFVVLEGVAALPSPNGNKLGVETDHDKYWERRAIVTTPVERSVHILGVS